jgi:tripartite-type tricarboxylate transporter receptor subunit TctC
MSKTKEWRVSSSLLVWGSLSCCLCFGSAVAQTDNYPNKPIRLVVPFVPGGGSDTVARALAHGLTERLGQQVIVDNRGGANTIIGTELVAKSRPDGYTLLVCTGSFVINPSLYKLNYDTLKDLTPVTMYLRGQLLLVVNSTLPVHNVKELIALAKAKPGELTFASYGTGSPGHLAGELFKSMTGVDMLHIGFKGSAPSIAEVIAGRVSMTFGVLTPTLPHVKTGRLRALGFATPERNPEHPEIPTIAETVPGFEAVGLNGICAPSGTPKPILNQLHAAITDVFKERAVRTKLIQGGADIVERPLPPEEFGPLVRKEIAKWKKVVDYAGIKVE